MNHMGLTLGFPLFVWPLMRLNSLMLPHAHCCGESHFGFLSFKGLCFSSAYAELLVNLQIYSQVLSAVCLCIFIIHCRPSRSAVCSNIFALFYVIRIKTGYIVHDLIHKPGSLLICTPFLTRWSSGQC